MYSFDPYANITSENEHLVVGGQAMMWCEQTDNANLDDTGMSSSHPMVEVSVSVLNFVVWPRAAANAGLW